MTTVIRAAGVPDALWLAPLAERMFRETYGVHNTPENMELYVAKHFGQARQAAELADGSMVTLVAEVDGEAAGYVQLGRRDVPESVTGALPMEVVRFYVDRPFHGSGLARQLMDAAASAARAEGARTLWLGVWERNPRAIAFYRKCGFRDTGTVTFVLGDDLQCDLVLARPLD